MSVSGHVLQGLMITWIISMRTPELRQRRAGDPELVLRKILGGGARESFGRRGVDFAEVKVTPQAVMDILQDYPELLVGLTRALEKST